MLIIEKQKNKKTDKSMNSRQAKRIEEVRASGQQEEGRAVVFLW